MLKQEDHEFGSGLGYLEDLVSKQKLNPNKSSPLTTPQIYQSDAHRGSSQKQEYTQLATGEGKRDQVGALSFEEQKLAKARKSNRKGPGA